MKRKNIRKNIPKDREADVLHSSRRRCALCFAYHSDITIKKGQIAHIDRNPENNELSNLAFLCLPHHDEYDGKTSQSKGWTPKELVESKKKLADFIKESFNKISPEIEMSRPIRNIPAKPKINKEKRQKITPEIYNLRIPIYHAYRDFVTKVLRDAKIDMQDLFEFASKTHESLFLYDERIADFLSLIFQKGNRLQYLNKLISNPRLVEEGKWNSIIEEESDLIQWFHDNFEQARKLFKEYLNLE